MPWRYQKAYFWELLFSHSGVSDSLRPRGLQHTRLPCPSLSPRACSNSCPFTQWWHPTSSSSVIPSRPAVNHSQQQGLFHWVGSSHQVAKVEASVSASVLSMNVQGWFPLGLIGLISLHTTLQWDRHVFILKRDKNKLVSHISRSRNCLWDSSPLLCGTVAAAVSLYWRGRV